MKIAVTTSDGTVYTDTVAANAPQRLRDFTGAGLVNAQAAVRAVRH